MTVANRLLRFNAVDIDCKHFSNLIEMTWCSTVQAPKIHRTTPAEQRQICTKQNTIINTTDVMYIRGSKKLKDK